MKNSTKNGSQAKKYIITAVLRIFDCFSIFFEYIAFSG